MDESAVLALFDGFVQSGTVIHDDQANIVEHVDGTLKVRFLLTGALNRKPTLQDPGNSTAERDGSDIRTTGFDMGDVGKTHILVANKYALARPHIMVLTADGYRRQYEALDDSDLTAAWTVLNSLGNKGRGTDYVVFFNCGQDGGCSRLHKHMQLVPTPVQSFASFLDSESEPEPDVPFRWFHHRFAPPDNKHNNQLTPARLAEIYVDLLAQAAAVGKDGCQHSDTLLLPGAAPCPHNLIFTRRWMLVIPRRRGAVQTGIAANSIGMLGVIPVASQEEIDSWIKFGTARALSELGVAK